MSVKIKLFYWNKFYESNLCTAIVVYHKKKKKSQHDIVPLLMLASIMLFSHICSSLLRNVVKMSITFVFCNFIINETDSKRQDHPRGKSCETILWQLCTMYTFEFDKFLCVVLVLGRSCILVHQDTNNLIWSIINQI